MTAIAKKAKTKGYISESKFEGVFQFFLKLVFVIMSITFIYPYLHVLVQSFENPNFVNAAGFKLWPKQFTEDAYVQMFNADYLWSGYANTLKVCFMGWALSISAVVLCAYPLSKKDLPFRGIFTTIVIARNFFMGLPAGLEEAATIDGANSWQILFKVMLPLSTPVLATISLWVVVSNWNAYFNCLLYITDSSKYVLQVVLRRIILTDSAALTQVDSELSSTLDTSTETLRAASIMLATIPIICVYPFVQKYFAKGMLMGSLKG